MSSSLGLATANQHEIVIHLVETLLFIGTSILIMRDRNTIVLLISVIFDLENILHDVVIAGGA